MILLLAFPFAPRVSAAAESSKTRLEAGCWFNREGDSGAPAVAIPLNLKSVKMADYFRIFYPPADSQFADVDRDGVPEILQKNQSIFERSRHLLQTELGWKVPVSVLKDNMPELHVYFINSEKRFTATTRYISELQILFNRSVLYSKDFPAIWIHQLTHASEIQYKPEGDYWFFEATAGWMEGQFMGSSLAARLARSQSLQHPETPLTDSAPISALGSARFVEMIARPYRDVVRQVWESWSYSKEESLMDVIRKVLELNHLARLESYLQNYFLLSASKAYLDTDSVEVSVKPFSAATFTGLAEHSSGGARLAFISDVPASYSTSVLFFTGGEKSGTLAMETGLQNSWSILVPYADMDHYRLVIVNHSAAELRGRVQKSYDSTIPAAIEYFRVNPGEGGVQIEWKTAKENGVAFWNLYRVDGGQKERLNDFPIPAAISSDEGIHYIFLDSSAGSFYTLEAITREGFQSRCAGSETPQ